jgi:hypothetical protein
VHTERQWVREGKLQEGQLAADRPRLSAANQHAVRTWNRLGGSIDWSGLPFVLAMDPTTDIHGLIERLLILREGPPDGR